MNTERAERDPLDVIGEEFIARFRRGERPSVTEFAQRFPEFADQMGDVLRALAFMEELRPAADAIPNANSANRTQAPQQLGEYRILREVGRGGMGVVYEAEQGSLGRRVALKVLPTNALLDTTQIQRFRREAKAAAKLHHTNIVPVFGTGEQDGVHYYVMQFIRGHGLDAVLREVTRLRVSPRNNGQDDTPSAFLAQSMLMGKFDRPDANVAGGSSDPSAAGDKTDTHSNSSSGSTSLVTDSTQSRTYCLGVARIAVQAAEALAYAHSQGVLHRDIKPSNLLLDNQGTVWVTDFGLAKADDAENLTHTGDVVGTLRYLPPERFAGQSDPRGDVYALGLTVYEMLTLRPAFVETDRGRLIYQVTHDAPPSPRQLDRRIPRDLETIVLKSIAKEPRLRYSSAGAMAEDLKRFIEDRPIAARRTNLREKVWRWSRRNPALAAVTSLLFVALIAGLAGVGWKSLEVHWKSLEVQKERDDAVTQRNRAEDHRRKAFAAVDRMLTRVADEKLLHVPQMDEKRRQLLEDALGFYQEFLQEDTTDPVTRLEVGRAYGRIGNIHHWLGRLDQADGAYRQGQALLEQLTIEFPRIPQNRLALAQVHRGMGMSDEKRGQSAAGEANHLKSISLLEELERDQPANREYQRALGVSHNDVGGLYLGTRQLAKAQAAFLSAIVIEERLIRDDPRDEENQEALAASLGNLATVYMHSGRETEAEETFLKAIGAWEDLVRDHPDNDEHLGNFASAYQNLGILYRQRGPLEKAETTFTKTLDLRQQLSRLHPQIPLYKSQLGVAHQNMATLYRAMSRNKDAEEAYEKALAVQEPLARAHPDVPEYRMSLGQTYNNLGMFHVRAGQVAKAEAAYEQALAAHGELRRSHGENLKFAVNFAGSCINFADFLRTNGKLETAIERYTQAIEAFEDALKREPHLDQSREGLFGAHWGRAMAWVQADHFDKANADWRRAVELSQGQVNITMRTYRPLPLAYLGDHTRATREAETILAETKVEAGVVFDYACVYSLCSAAVWNDTELPSAELEPLSERYALRAVELLARARAAGRFNSPKRIEGLKTSRTFEPLHSRADFQKFVAELEAVEKPKSP